jgi:hypothetical protein
MSEAWSRRIRVWGWTWAKITRPHLKNNKSKKDMGCGSRDRALATWQGQGPEFNPHYHQQQQNGIRALPKDLISPKFNSLKFKALVWPLFWRWRFPLANTLKRNLSSKICLPTGWCSVSMLLLFFGFFFNFSIQWKAQSPVWDEDGQLNCLLQVCNILSF